MFLALTIISVPPLFDSFPLCQKPSGDKRLQKGLTTYCYLHPSGNPLFHLLLVFQNCQSVAIPPGQVQQSILGTGKKSYFLSREKGTLVLFNNFVKRTLPNRKHPLRRLLSKRAYAHPFPKALEKKRTMPARERQEDLLHLFHIIKFPGPSEAQKAGRKE